MPASACDSLVFSIGRVETIVSYTDITSLAVDAIVSSDDTDVSMGGGLSATIRQRAGETVREEARKQLPAKQGDVVVTSAGKLPAKKIFHALVIDYYHPDGAPTADTIRSVIRKSINLCQAHGLRSIAFPALAIGTAGLNPGVSASAVVQLFALLENQPAIDQVRIALDPARSERAQSFFRAIEQYLVLSAANHQLRSVVGQVAPFVRIARAAGAELVDVQSMLNTGLVRAVGADAAPFAEARAALLKKIAPLNQEIFEAIKHPTGDSATKKATLLRLELTKAFAERTILEYEGRDLGLSGPSDPARHASVKQEEDRLRRELEALETAAVSSTSTHLVLLVHGINTRARWFNVIRPALRDAGFAAEPCGYDVYGIVRFLMPFAFLRSKAIELVRTKMNLAIEVHKPQRVSVIAHSFGSYIVARLLAQEFQQKWHRIIFCGSVNAQDFPFQQYLPRFTHPIVNEIGSRDVLPALAERVTWGYGSIGSHGAASAAVEERWHNGLGHSDFLTAEFCKKYWIPWLRDETFVRNDDEPQALPLWARLLIRLPLRWIVLAGLAAFAVTGGQGIYAAVRGPQPEFLFRYRSQPVSVEAPLSDVGLVVAQIVQDMNENCTRGWFSRWNLGQKCLSTQVGAGVTAVKGCEAFIYPVRNPEEALHLAAAQFSCLDVTEMQGAVSVSVRPGSTRTWNDGAQDWVLCGCTEDHIQALRKAAP